MGGGMNSGQYRPTPLGDVPAEIVSKWHRLPEAEARLLAANIAVTGSGKAKEQARENLRGAKAALDDMEAQRAAPAA